MLTCEEYESVQLPVRPEWSITCRTCLHAGETRSVFEVDHTKLSLAEKVMLCSNVVIRKDDNLPVRICVECIEELEVAYRFRVNCESSDAILQSYMDGSADKFTDAGPTAALQGDEIKQEIAIPLDSGIMYTYKPPSGLNIKLIQRPRERIAPDHITLNNEPEYESNEYDEEVISELNSQANVVLHDTLQKESSNNVDIEIEHVEEFDTESYTYERVTNDGTMVTPVNNILMDTTLVTPNRDQTPNHISRVGDSKNLLSSAPKSVRTLQTIRKTNTPNETKPTIETVTTQTAADGSGVETVIRIKRNLPSAKQSHICEICNTSYKHKNALDTHLRRHRGDRPYKCEHCDKAFVVPFELRRHTRIHTGHKPYKCQYCDRTYSDFGSKTKHERTHTGERPYRCNYCSKTFSYSHVLNSHLLIHTGEKKYSCSTCGKRFTKSHHLKGHQKMHLTVSAKTPHDKQTQISKRNTHEEDLSVSPTSGDSIEMKDESTPTVIMMDHQQTDQGLVDSFVNATRLTPSGWTLTDVGLPLPDAATDSGETDDGVPAMVDNAVVTIEPEELENVSIVSFNDYILKTEGIERLMMHSGGESNRTDGTTGHTHGMVDSLQEYVTVLLPKSESALDDADFGDLEIIDG